MRPRHAIALCALLSLAGCGAVAGPSTDAGSTATPSPTAPPATAPTAPTTADSVPTMTEQPTSATPSGMDLPDGVDPSAVVRYSSLSSGERATFRRARNASGYVELGSDSALETFSNHRYVLADSRLWAVEATYGRIAYYASETEVDDEPVVAFENLSAAQRERFRRVVDRAGAYVLGPDEQPVDFPDPVRYENRTYVVERGTASSEYGVLHAYPYGERTATPG